MPRHVAPSVRRALLAGAAVAAFGAFTAPGADAAFSIGQCQASGSAVKGQGSSFQTDLQTDFASFFAGSNGCNGSEPSPTYNPNGSGNGIASMGGGGGNATLNCTTLATPCSVPLPAGQRDPSTSFAGSDDPPSPTQQQSMNAGTSSPSDNGNVHVIPIATGASAFIVHAPEGCDLSTVTNLTNGATGSASGNTGDGAANHTQRIRISGALLEKAFAGDADANTWGEIAPGISGVPTNAQETGIATCASVPVKRIVRQDSSGTTFSWKAYLNLIGTGRGWTTTYAAPNTLWPAAGGAGTATATPEPTNVCPNTEANLLCSASGSGGGALAGVVNATDGSIGYVDLATARKRGFDITPSATTQDYTFWSPLETSPNGSASSGTYAEPTSDATAHSGGTGQKGANCVNAPIVGVPTAAGSPNGDPTLGDWSHVIAAGGAAYPACVLTYALAWDDNAPVYGNTAAEQGKARVVKDYLSLIVSSIGQLKLTTTDYSPLPAGLLTDAQNAVNAIGWDKAAGSGGGGGGGGGGGTPPPTGGGGTPPPPSPPSNVFALPSRKLSSTLITYTVQVPGAGTLKVVATTKVGRKTITGASLSAHVSGGGKVTVKLRLSARARSALARARGRKLKFTVKFTFTPTGGSARTVTKTVTIVAPKPRKRR
jgi:ABC-type phosphate transport system substrate-binding protein